MIKIEKKIRMIQKIENTIIADLLHKFFKLYINFRFYFYTGKAIGTIESSEVIVSLTSYPKRIKTVRFTIETMLQQTYKPQRIILWLAEEQFPQKEQDLPQKLLQLRSRGLEIRFCEDLYSHKKYYFTMKENPSTYVLTVDDDVLYPETLVAQLLKQAKREAGKICCTVGHELKYNEQGEIASYNEWRKMCESNEKSSLQIMPVGCGGVIYPPNSLDCELFNKNAIRDLCLTTDDLWLKSMAVKKGTEALVVGDYSRMFFTILSTQSEGLHYKNVAKCENDLSLERILLQYPEVEETLKSYN